MGGTSLLVEGGGWTSLVLEGNLFGPQTRILLRERDGDGTWIAREYLPGEVVDFQHVRIQVPPGYLTRPTIIGFAAYDEDSGLSPDSDVKPPEQTLYVTSKDSPVLSSIEPSEVSADEAQKNVLTVRIHGGGFTPSSKVLLSLENGSDLGQRGLIPQFLSPYELQIDLPSERFIIDRKWSAPGPVRLWVANDDVFHVSNEQEIRVIPSTDFPAYPSDASRAAITHISPYPVPLMNSESPASLMLTVQGEHFRAGEYIVAATDKWMEDVKLKTEYVSSQELHAWLPQRLWYERRFRCRLVVQTAAESCVAEVVEENDQ